MLEFFFIRTTILQLVGYPQDPAGGTIPTPSPLAVLVPVAVQQDMPPEKLPDGTYRRGTKVRVTVFFNPAMADSPDYALAALKQLRLDSRLILDDGRTILLEGEPFDRAGQGAVYEAACKYTT
jgi:hypothetical protein